MFLTSGEMSPRDAWTLYKNVSTLARVVDLIADQVAHLPPVLEIDGHVVEQHPILDLINRPGFNRTRRRFIKETVVEILTAGYAPLHVIGNNAGLPVAIDLIRAQNTVHQQGSDGWPATFHVSEPTRGMTFRREGNVNFRWFESPFSELMPIYDMAGDHKGIGLSRLQAVRNDVELRARAVIHNRSLIDKGARLSGVLSFKEALTPEQYAAAEEGAAKALSGNAGGIFISSGGSADFTSVMMTPRDMDWGTLTTLVDDAVAARYNVPVTLFNVKAQTNNNYETAWRMLFDNAVLPTFTVVYEPLAAMFSERLGGIDIAFRPKRLAITVLAEQAAANATKLHGAGLITRDEARSDIGMEPSLGGDVFYISAGMVPAGEDFFTEVDRRLGDGGDADSEIPADDQPESQAVGAGKRTRQPDPAAVPKKKSGSGERRLN